MPLLFLESRGFMWLVPRLWMTKLSQIAIFRLTARRIDFSSSPNIWQFAWNSHTACLIGKLLRNSLQILADHQWKNEDYYEYYDGWIWRTSHFLLWEIGFPDPTSNQVMHFSFWVEFMTMFQNRPNDLSASFVIEIFANRAPHFLGHSRMLRGRGTGSI